jgi:hypothetical protein
LHRLGVELSLRQSLATTNMLESIFSDVEQRTGKNGLDTNAIFLRCVVRKDLAATLCLLRIRAPQRRRAQTRGAS